MTETTRWGRLAAAGAALIVAAIGVLMFAGRGAGARLETVSPADGAVLREPPRQVSIGFDAAVRPAQIHIGVSDQQGNLARTGASSVNGATITQPVSIGSDGDYVLAYHVVLDDGRTLSGSSRFRVSAQATAEAPAPAAALATGHDHFGDDPLSVVLTVVAGAFVAALLVMIIHRPPPRRD